MRNLLMFLALGVVAWLPPDAEGKRTVFRWQDADGTVHYADHPGAPGAQVVEGAGRGMSVVDTSEARARAGHNAMRPVIEREIRWQERGREEQRRVAEQEIAAKQRRCAQIRQQLEKAEQGRRHARVRALEEQWFDACR